MIGKDQLALMKPTAYLLNNSRGHVVDEAPCSTRSTTTDRRRGDRHLGPGADPQRSPAARRRPRQADPDRPLRRPHRTRPSCCWRQPSTTWSPNVRASLPPYVVNPRVEQAWRARACDAWRRARVTRDARRQQAPGAAPVRRGLQPGPLRRCRRAHRGELRQSQQARVRSAWPVRASKTRAAAARGVPRSGLGD